MALAEISSLHSEQADYLYRFSSFGMTPEVLPFGRPEVADIIYYPVKSFAGIRLSEGVVGTRGLLGDRGAMVTTPEGDFLTQREIPMMSQVQPRFVGDKLELHHGSSQISFHIKEEESDMRVNIWRDKGLPASDQGDEVAQFLTKLFGVPCRLVVMPDETRRPVDPVYAQYGEETGFADGFPFLLISQGSLDDLNNRLAAKGIARLPMNRFRPNIVVKGVPAYAEDTWKRIRIGDLEMDVTKPCARCVITETDQVSGERHRLEPLKTLASYRSNKHLGITRIQGAFFGQNLIHRGTGSLRVGESMEVLEYA